MTSVQIGDEVRVSESVASDYAGQCGVIVGTEQRQAGAIRMTECEVEFNDGVRRSFLIFQLKPVPLKNTW